MTDGLLTPIEGPVFDIARPVLERLPAYARRNAGALSNSQWARVVDQARPAIVRAGFPPHEIPFLKRIPANPERLITNILADLARQGLVAGPDAAPTSGHMPGFNHGGRTTFIYPEEGALLERLVASLGPRRTIFLGSYYGYWASFAVPNIVAGVGRAILVDPDPAVARIAQANFSAQPEVEVVCDTAERYLSQCADTFDLVVLDAELPRDHPDPALRGKGLYCRLLQAVLPHLRTGAVLVAHNILFNDQTGDPFFDEVIARNRTELSAFMELAKNAFGFVEYQTTEGVGIGQLRSKASSA
ncbi:O-methyltransferase [Hoeflea poritis]|uniref:Class I SAM-dependent methyltransferase n=1 Tax=Hoeflea poritis TaxID=2993659 RepID=A0ABT4VKJ2_9HYPH|nr:class I SAM-dependent methyltransferase [Hoeflea poritis]MDA4845233.1 class I SAM-dependent methyltransferase [Hoeflea poritis]